MRSLLLTLGFIFLFTATAMAGEVPYAEDWTLQFGGEGQDILVDFALAEDGSLLLAGSATSPSDDAKGSQDAWLLRVDEDGELLWSRRYGGSGDDAFTQLALLENGDILLLGTTTSDDGDVRNYRGEQDAWVLRLDPQGEVLWQKCLGGSAEDELLDLSFYGQEQAVFAGRSRSRNGDLSSNHGGYDAWAASIELETGRSIWHYRYGSSGDDEFHYLLSNDQSWMLLGYHTQVDEDHPEAEPEQKPILVFLSREGVEQSFSAIDVGRHTQIHYVELVEDGWWLSGQSQIDSGEAWVSHITTDGKLLWQSWYRGNSSSAIHAQYSQPNGLTLLLGTTHSSGSSVPGTHGGQDIWILLLDAENQVLWQQALGGSGASQPIGLVHQPDGRYLIVANTSSRDGDLPPHDADRAGWLVLLAPNGNVEGQLLLAPTKDQEITAFLSVGEDALYLLGQMPQDNGRVGAWLMRLVRGE